MTWALRGLAVALAALLLYNNILAAKGDVPVVVTMVAIAFLPLLFERSMRGGVLVVAFFALWAYVLPSAIERAGAQREVHLETRERHEQRAEALSRAQRRALAECATGYGTRCRGVLAVIETKREAGQAAPPPPAGVEVLSLILGLQDADVPTKILTMLNALGSEVAIAVLIHMAVFWQHAKAVPVRSAPTIGDASDLIQHELDSADRVVAADVYNTYLEEWGRRGLRTMSRDKFMRKLQYEAGVAGFVRSKHRGKIGYERE